MADITGLLHRWGKGDGEAFKALMPLVYAELRRLARHHLRNERADHTLQPTALVHWTFSRAWLCHRLAGEATGEPPANA